MKSWEKFTSTPVICSHFTMGYPKVLFNNIIHAYFWLFVLSQNETNCDCELAYDTWKMSPHYLVKCRTHSSDGRYISLQTLVALNRRVALCGNLSVRQATSQQVFKFTTSEVGISESRLVNRSRELVNSQFELGPDKSSPVWVTWRLRVYILADEIVD